MNYVYHASPKSWLASIEPNRSTHMIAWVYAAFDKVMSSVFLGRNLWDFLCGVGKEKDGTVFICERYPGAMKDWYDSPGSIYTLPGGMFQQSTSWKEECVSKEVVIPLSEEKIENSLAYLESLEKDWKIRLYWYPNRPDHIPLDDSDLVRKAVDWIQQWHKDIIQQLSEQHPHLIDRVHESLAITQ